MVVDQRQNVWDGFLRGAVGAHALKVLGSKVFDALVDHFGSACAAQKARLLDAPSDCDGDLFPHLIL